MVDFFAKLFSADFMPHGMCYLWDPVVLWLNVIADALIAFSYYAIPFLLFRFARQRRDLGFHWVFVAFGLFILACGTTHLLAVVTVWLPVYRLDGAVKAVTAGSSLVTAWLLIPLPWVRANAAPAAEGEERKAAREEVRESTERYRFLADAMPQMVWTSRPDGWLDYYNQRWHEYTGLTLEQSQGWGWAPAIHPDDLQNTMDRWKQAVGTGGEYQMEYRVRRANDGAYRWHLGRAIPRRNQHGEIVQWVGTCTDIDDMKRASESVEQANRELREEMALRHQAEEQLVHSQKMDAVGRLAGGVAHDFNNLLTGIIGFGALLEEELKDRRLMEYVREILSAAGRASTLTNQLLAFGRRQTARPRVVNLNEIVAEFQKMLRRIIGEDIDLVTHLAGDLAPVKIDPGQVDQILMNLVVNARDAMAGGGRLNIETANVHLGPDAAGRHIGVAPGAYIMLAVRDTGTGMDAETRQRLFEPFFTTKETGRGTGLGLSIVYGIVKQNGGDIRVYSEPGHGSTFKIYFPASGETPAEPVAAPEPVRTAGQGTVLLVEDEPVVLKFVSFVLRQRGYRVLEAANGPEALELSAAFEGPIDLLLTDVVLPGTNGPDLAAQLAEARHGIRVLFMSGYPHPHMSRLGLIQYDMAYLQKPFTNAALNQKVAELLGR